MIFWTSFSNWSSVQKMWASSCVNWITLKRPPSVPESSTLWTVPISPTLNGRSLYVFGEVL